MRSENIAGVRVDFDMSYKDVLSKVDEFVSSGESHYLWTVNPEFIMDSQQDTEFKQMLNEGSLTPPDGVGLLLADKYFQRVANIKHDILFPLRAFVCGVELGLKTILGKENIGTSIVGVDLVYKLCEQSAKKNYSVFLLGGWETNALGRKKKRMGMWQEKPQRP